MSSNKSLNARIAAVKAAPVPAAAPAPAAAPVSTPAAVAAKAAPTPKKVSAPAPVVVALPVATAVVAPSEEVAPAVDAAAVTELALKLDVLAKIDLIEKLTKSLTKEIPRVMKPSVKKAIKDAASPAEAVEKKPPTIHNQWTGYVATLAKAQPELVPVVTSLDAAGNEVSKRIGHMTWASQLKATKTYDEFLATLSLNRDEVEAKAAVKPAKKTDEEKAAEKLAKLETKAATKKPASKKSAAPPKLAAPAPEPVIEADGGLIEFELNGVKYCRMETGETYILDEEGNPEWAGMYDPVTNKIDESVTDPNA
jgi:hypothetical protein